MEHQAMLMRADVPDARFVVDEGALRNVIADRAPMREQLERAPESAELPSVTLQILPLDSGTYPATGTFTILGFPAPEDPDLVYRDGITDAVHLEGEHHVREYTKALDGLRAAALSPQRSAQLIKSVLKEYASWTLQRHGTTAAWSGSRRRTATALEASASSAPWPKNVSLYATPKVGQAPSSLWVAAHGALPGIPETPPFDSLTREFLRSGSRSAVGHSSQDGEQQGADDCERTVRRNT